MIRICCELRKRITFPVTVTASSLITDKILDTYKNEKRAVYFTCKLSAFRLRPLKACSTVSAKAAALFVDAAEQQFITLFRRFFSHPKKVNTIRKKALRIM